MAASLLGNSEEREPSPSDYEMAQGDAPNEGLGHRRSNESIGEPGEHDEREIETHMIVAPSISSSDSERGSVEPKHIESAD
jgi:hypothetical protein